MTFSFRAPKSPVRARRAPRRRLNTLAQGALGAPTWASPFGSISRARLVALGLVAVCSIALYAFFDLDYFYVFNFNVTGTRYLPRAEIEKASGIRGYHIAFIDARAVERALLQLPEVKAATVTVRLPNSVAIEIRERQPELVWQRGNETFWVDAEGVFLRARAALPELPTVRDLEGGNIQPGTRAQARAVAAVWALRAAMPESPRALEWSAARGVAFTDARGWQIYLGDADGMPGKVAILRALVAQLVAQNARIRFIDVGKGTPYYQLSIVN